MEISNKTNCLICGAGIKPFNNSKFINCFINMNHYYSYNLELDHYRIGFPNHNGFTKTFFSQRKIQSRYSGEIFELHIDGSEEFNKILPSIKEFLIQLQNYLILK